MGVDKKDSKDRQIQADEESLQQEQPEDEKPDQEEEQLEARLRQMTDDVQVPDSLKPENLEKLLPRKGSKKPFKWRAAYTAYAVAACCILVIGIGAYGMSKQGLFKGDMAAQRDTPASSDGRKISAAKGYDEVYEYIKAEESYFNDIQERTLFIASQSESSEGAGESKKNGGMEEGAEHSDTNIRQEGVEEGDIVKTDGEYLYVLSSNTIGIVNIKNEQMEPEGVIRFEDTQTVSEIYIKDKKLIVLYTKMETEKSADGESIVYNNLTVAETFDVTIPSEPKSIGSMEQSGEFYTLRVSGQYAYVISTFNAYTGARRDIETYIPKVGGSPLESEDILLPQYNGGSQYTVISTFSLDEPDKRIDSKAVLGSMGLVYVSGRNIYVCESYYNSEESEVTQTFIRKVEYKDGELRAIGQVKVDGALNDSFSIDEFEGNLRLVTTVSSAGAGGALPIVYRGELPELGEEEEKEKEKDTNALYILDDALNKLGAIEGLAEDERVYSARFMGNAGYFVTFKQVDPLFSVDLSDPGNPKILGELKIPGFSNYLHPYGENMILGIGMEADETGTTTEGVKLSMFDISDPANVKEANQYVLKDYFSTNVDYNYKAALIREERNLIAFSAYGTGQHFYVFSYDKDAGFQVLLDKELEFSDARGVYSGNTLYIVGGNTVESYSLDTFEKIDDIII